MRARTALLRTWISTQAMVTVSVVAAIALMGAGVYAVKGQSLSPRTIAHTNTHAPNEQPGSQQTPSYTFIGTHVPTHRAQHASNHTASDG
jgi:hypothetical protein